MPMLRNAFIPSTDLSGWRMVYIVPAVVTLAISVFALFFVRESDAYLDSRIRQLEMTEEEKQQQAEKKRRDANQQPGIVSGLKLIFSHKQLLWLCIANGFITVGLIMTMYYETTMTYGFAQHFLAEGMNMDAAKLEATGIVTQALMLFPIGSAVFQMMQGFFSDALGRKSAAIIMSAASLSSFATFFVGAQQFWNPYVVGFFAGAAAGSYWAAGDIIGLMMTESSPTRLRTSAGSAGILVYMPIALAFIIMFVVAMNVMGDEKIGILCLAFAGLGLAVGLLILSFKTKETKGVDLGEVQGDEFE